MSEAVATVSAYTVSRFSDDDPNYGIWSIRVEASGNGRWAVRSIGRCLSTDGEWDYEPIPSSRTDEWLDAHRFPDVYTAIAVAIDAEATLRINGKTAAEILATPHPIPSRGEQQ